MADIIAIACFAIAGALAVTAAIEDARTHLLRDVYTLPIVAIAAVGLPLASSFDDGSVGAALADMAQGAGWFAGPWLITHLIAPKQIGFGDIKLSIGLGMLLGWLSPSLASLGFFAASITFGVFAIASRVTTREALPFGPALVVGAGLVTAVRFIP